MKMRVASLAIMLALLSTLAVAQNSAATSGAVRSELSGLLRNFLDGAAKGDKAAFERFFAEDVIYTRAVGVVLDRATILGDVAPPKPGEPVARYDADDILVHQSGDVAIVNFRLVVHTDDKGKQDTVYYRNTGTFQRRDGAWKAIAWQATPIAEKKN